MSIEKITPGDEITISKDLVTENIEKLKELFPEVLTEGKIDFKVLQQILGEEIEEGEEYYRFTWAGKSQARREAHKPSTGTLRPVKDESVDWDTTQNLYIEGDNLEVLKLLQKSYAGQVKMIYIDPPYNTGKDFVYKDNYKDNLKNYQEITGQIDSEGNKLSTNSESEGRFHSNWLNMMYPRLELARNLLKKDGVIFISISDKEFHNLKKVCDEIFGENCFLSAFVWNSEGNTDNQLEVKINHEYILCYLRDIKFKSEAIGNVIDPNTREDSNLHEGIVDNNINKNNPANPPDIIELPVGFPSTEKELFYEKKILDSEFFEITKTEKYISDEIKTKYNLENLSGLPVKLDDMIISNYQLVKPCRIYGGFANRNKLEQFIENGLSPVYEEESPIKFYINSNAAVRYRKENVSSRNILSVLRNLGTTEKTKTQLKRMGVYFSYPKPTDLIQYLVKIGGHKRDSIILDFFAGSCSTAHAVLKLNAENIDNAKDVGQCKYIMVQLQEKTDVKGEAYKAGYKTVSDIGKERICKVIEKIKEDAPEQAKRLDLGFKLLKLDSSNIKPWDGDPENLERNLWDTQDNIKEGRSEEDVLYEILLKYGLDLTLPIEERQIEGIRVFNVGYGALFVCLGNNITSQVAEGIGKWKEEVKPEICRVIFKDSGFNDVEKTNAAQTLKRFGIHEIKSI